MRVREVKTGKDMRRFVFLPSSLYRGDSLWVPPLWVEEKNAYTANRNSVLAHSDFTFFLVEEDGEILGRSLVYVDHAFNAYYRARTGFFGAFECRDDFNAARALDDAASDWLTGKGMERVRGPINPVSECWGFLLDGFKAPPVFMAPYNPQYYNAFMAALGYQKAKDLIAYEASNDDGYVLPQRFENFTARFLANNPGFRLRPLSLKRLDEEAEAVWNISNVALKDNWGYVPLDRVELRDMLLRLKPIADPDAVWFVEDRGRPVAYALGFPDLNIVLRRIGGKLLPFGFLHVLFGAKKVPDYRLFGLAVLPEYHNKGLDVLLYRQICRALQPRIRRLEINYILEDNLKIRNALEKLELTLIKRYRVYEKELGRRKAPA